MSHEIPEMVQFSFSFPISLVHSQQSLQYLFFVKEFLFGNPATFNQRERKRERLHPKPL